MDPITFFIILKIIAAFTAGVAVVHLAQLTIETVFNWFRSRTTLSASKRDNIAVTVSQGIKNGKYEVVRGVFNKRTNTMVESEVIHADRLDEELARRHRYSKIVEYEYYEY